MKQILLATRNLKKQAELQALLGTENWEILTLSDFPNCPETIEDGSTFLENARKKALEAAAFSGLATVADDSGLEVDALGGAPGVYSARYARGEGSGDDENNQALLKALSDVPYEGRGARYVCALVLAQGGAVQYETEQTVEGRILAEYRGVGGFGYDPLFYYPPFNATFAEVPIEEKHKVSHRGKAMRLLVDFLNQQV